MPIFMPWPWMRRSKSRSPFTWRGNRRESRRAEFWLRLCASYGGLNIGDSTHVRDIPPSEKYEVLTDPDIPLASVAPPISEAKYEEIVTAPEGEREVVQPERVGEKEEGAEPEEAKEKK
jgi:hypothetical protein